MRGNPVLLVWVLGLLLAAVIYALGPGQFVQQAWLLLDRAWDAAAAFADALTGQVFDLVRALAIALLVVFLVLGVLAARRGLRARASLVVVPVMFLVLVPTMDGGSAAGSRWLAALVLAGVAALSMTRRLMGAPRDVRLDARWDGRP